MSDVLLRVQGTLGRITLNRPRALNALTQVMVDSIDAILARWEHDRSVQLVLIDGAGERGFCAGGDIRVLYESAVAGDPIPAQNFFRAEYRLNARIAVYSKPVVALMDGLTMGGGIGLSAHAAHRVVTERSRLAMPEVGIGFLPDVGGTWLLSRAPGQLGVHAALTAAQLGPADAMLCGLADLHVPFDRLPTLTQDLASCEAADAAACIQSHATQAESGTLAGARSWIDACYKADIVETIVAALAAHAEPAARDAAADIGRKSPLSEKVALRALREAPTLGGLEACLEREYQLALAMLAGPDFREGVRAALVDKDRNPAWSPATLEGVTPAMVDAIFTAPFHGGLGLTRF